VGSVALVALEARYGAFESGFGITVGIVLFVMGVSWGIGAVRRLLDV
jgi:hypothetical protein